MPTTTSQDCPTCCGSGSSSSSTAGSSNSSVTCCCGNGQVAELTAEVSEISGCPCGDGVIISMPIINDCEDSEGGGASSEWEGSEDFCSTSLRLLLDCGDNEDPQDWLLTVEFQNNCNSTLFLNPEPGASCNPIDMTFVVGGIEFCCDLVGGPSQVAINITE